MSKRSRGRAGRYRLSREDRASLGGRRRKERAASAPSIRISPAVLRIVGGVAGVAAVVFVLSHLLGGGRGVTSGGGTDEALLEEWMEEVEQRVRASAQELGMRESWIRVLEPGDPDGDSLLTAVEFRVPGDLHLEVLNLAITRAVEGAGGSVVRGIELNDARVELEIAFDGHRTHRFILQRYSGYRRHAGRIGLVIDDWGRASQEMLDSFAAIGVPWTATVIPGTPGSRQQANYFTSRGIPVLIHMPMEPEAGDDWELGDGAIYVDTPREEVDRLVARAISDVPGASGLNNHMGSRATREPALMRALMNSLKARGLYFLDSRTTGGSVAASEAERAEIAWAQRDVFLDPEDDRAVIERQFQEALEVAGRNGSVILMGHPRRNTLEVLRELLPRARQAGFEFVTLDRLINRPGRRQ